MNDYKSLAKKFAAISVLMLFPFSAMKSFGDFEQISGRFVNQTFLNKLPESIPGTITFYCLEINFTGSDSAELYNGFEEFKLAYKKIDGNYLLVEAMQGKDLPFTLNADGNILLHDTMWTGILTGSEFIKVSGEDNISGDKWVFEKNM